MSPRLMLLFTAGAVLIGIAAVLQQDGSPAEPRSVAESPAAPDTERGTPRAVPRSLAARSEQALLEQVSCRRPATAGVAIQAMIRDGLLRETDDRADGSIVFVPTRPLNLFGYSVVRVTGWQHGEGSGAMPPFFRGPGTAPPNFISVTVTGPADQVRRKALEQGIREEEYVKDLSRTPYQLEGNTVQPQKLIPGISVEDGDLEFVEKPLDGVATVTCSASERDFQSR